MIRQKGFSKRLHDSLKENKNNKLSSLSEDDIDQFITEFWKTLAICLHKGIYVSFEGWISFFTKPIQRRCHDPHTTESWMTFKRRVRTKVLETFRNESEIDLTRDEIKKMVSLSDLEIEELMKKKKKDQ